MEKRIVYEAEDGTIFFTEEACKEYEERLHIPPEHMLIVAKEIQDFCSHSACYKCPFVTDNCECKLKKDYPNQWEL